MPDLEPITRRESIIAGEDIEPVTREEWFLKKYRGGGGHKDITAILDAGQTSLTIQDSSITTNSTIDYYTSVFGVNPTNAVVTTGQIVLTFEEQQSDIDVKVRIS